MMSSFLSGAGRRFWSGPLQIVSMRSKSSQNDDDDDDDDDGDDADDVQVEWLLLWAADWADSWDA